MEQYFTLANGVKIPNIGFGTWRVPESEQCENAVKCALGNGYRHIDTARFYKNERSVGRAVRASGIRRGEIFITSKLWNDVRGYDETIKAFELSRAALGTDYIDLYLIHWPNPAGFRDRWEQANADTWRAFEKLYADGKVKAIGVSNFLPHHLDALLKTAVVKPMVNQIELHPGLLRRKEREYHETHGIITEAWAPFQIGEVLKEPVIVSLAGQYGRTPAQIVLRWMLQRGVVPLPKSVTPERIAENINVYDFALSDEDMRRMDEIPEHAPRHNPDTIEF